ncbi:D-amino acid dehydrogenase [Pseudorhodoferax sp. Leaf267]|uniref:D-amino acid dehydrogenase n=1 Tax=Pseudorhodoferax sp. Leaf267 TaxID=1736316 RepID=UPI0006F370ED|nr:D-amino acid dehydrogenase [Pseudorhodoferax sp. Leaf267]KQP17728.1 amino acid dehydrogenase [Pseudorhodoferax sp. Leaf267]
MNIAIVGAGIVGITTAYALAAEGHQVTVFERHSTAAAETSFANAGVVAPGYVTPWAAPGMPGKVARYLLRRHAPIKIGLPLRPHELAWMWRWLKACKLEVYLANRARMQRLAFYSRDQLHKLTHELGLAYDRSDGYTVLLRSDQDAALVEPGLQVLRDAGVRFERLDAQATRRVEPALSPDMHFHGAIHLPDDEVGNCRQFSMLLKSEAQRLGVVFLFNTAVDAIQPGPLVQLRLAGSGEMHAFDALVCCAGVASSRLLRPLGVALPMAAVHGYSITAAIREPLNAPRSAVMDERYKVAISHLGQRVRVAGSAELGGPPGRQREASIQTLYKVLHDWFPGAAQLASGVQAWKGARPMLPDGPPLLGASGVPGVWLNVGHGSSGWALSCGSARVLADQIAGRTPDIDSEGLGIARLRS